MHIQGGPKAPSPELTSGCVVKIERKREGNIKKSGYLIVFEEEDMREKRVAE